MGADNPGIGWCDNPLTRYSGQCILLHAAEGGGVGGVIVLLVLAAVVVGIVVLFAKL